MNPYPPADATMTPAPCWSPADWTRNPDGTYYSPPNWTLRWNDDGTCFMVSTAGEVLGRCAGPGVIMRKDKKTGMERPLTICDLWYLSVQWMMELARRKGSHEP